jgi:2-phospho-L-lactate transferase CofD
MSSAPGSRVPGVRMPNRPAAAYVDELRLSDAGTGPLGSLGHATRVVALGGGHGLAASLSALRRVTNALTAVVTVSDDGGSSGRPAICGRPSQPCVVMTRGAAPGLTSCSIGSQVPAS